MADSSVLEPRSWQTLFADVTPAGAAVTTAAWGDGSHVAEPAAAGGGAPAGGSPMRRKSPAASMSPKTRRKPHHSRSVTAWPSPPTTVTARSRNGSGSRSRNGSRSRSRSRNGADTSAVPHRHCGACDRLTGLRDHSSPHALAVFIVKLEAELDRAKAANAASLRRCDSLHRQNVAAMNRAAAAERRAEGLEVAMKGMAKKLLEVQLKQEAVQAGITSPEAAEAYAAAESPRRMAELTAAAVHAWDDASGASAAASPGARGLVHRSDLTIDVYADATSPSTLASVSPARAATSQPSPGGGGGGGGGGALAAKLDSFVSSCVVDLESSMTSDRHRLEASIDDLQQSLLDVSAARDELQAELSVECDRRVEAEAAYKHLHDQTAPLRMGFTKATAETRSVLREHVRALEVNAAVCAQFASSLEADVKSHFGYVPLALQNKIRRMLDDLAVSPAGMHS